MSKMNRALLIAGMFGFVCMVSTASFAQSYQGSIRGLVTDSSNAVLVGAKITLTDEAKNVLRTVVSESGGEYVFPLVDPATYTLEVDVQGFQRFKQSGIIVGTHQTVTVDVTMQPGSVNQTVEVSAQEPLLDTADASTGTTLTERQLNYLPTNATDGRSPYSITNVSPNVVPPSITGGGFTDQNVISYTTVAGSPEATNQYLVDGIPISDTNNRPVFIPSIEAIQEMKVQVTTYDAEMARTGGGVWNTLLRSGTNGLHGSLFGVTKHSDWAANNFFNNRNGIPRPNTPAFYNYAGSLGGPVVIPHIYDGRNKTFWFIADEGLDQPQTMSGTFAVPTALERVGDFSKSFTASGALNVIYDPLTTTVVNGVTKRTPFQGNIIPSNRLSQIGLNIAAVYPLPTFSAPTGANDYVSPSITGGALRSNEVVTKLDHQLFPWWAVNASYVHYSSFVPGAAPAGFFLMTGGNNVYHRYVDATQLNSVFTPNPTTVISVRYGFNRFPNTILTVNQGFNPTSLGLPNYNYQSLFFPVMKMTNFRGLGNNNAQIVDWYSRNFLTSVAKQLGRHSVKAGFDYRGIYMAFTDLSDAPGTYSFTGQFTQASPSGAANGTGSAVADLLLGLPFSGMIEKADYFYNYARYFGAYVEDDFRVNRKLTLNLGLRYEYETGLKETNNNLVTGFNETVPSPLADAMPGVVGGLQYAGTGGATQCCDFSKLKFAPRVGFAFAINNKTTARGGYGMYYAPMRYDPIAVLQTGYATETPLVSSNNGGLTPSPTFSFSNPFPGGPQTPTGNALGLLTGVGTPIAAYDSGLKSPYVEQFSADVQRELPGHILLDVGYVGSRARHLIAAPQGVGSSAAPGGGKTNIDQLNPKYFSLGAAALSQSVPNPFYGHGGTGTIGNPTVAEQQLLLPFPQFTSVNLVGSYSSASYNSLVVKGEKRLSSGLAFLSSFTWSRNLDGSYETPTQGGASNVGPQNVYDLRAEWGRSFINLPLRFVTAFTYELPFGKGKPLLKDSRWADLVVGGWAVSAITVYETGFPLGITQNNLNAAIGAASQRPNLTPGVSPETSGSLYDRLTHYVNPAAFTVVPEYVFGNTPRTISMRGPGEANWDMTVTKSFPINERVNFTFRAEAEDLFNTPYFSMPNLVAGSSTFGQITAAQIARSLKLGGRLSF